MFEKIDKIFTSQNILHHESYEITVCSVANQKAGLLLAAQILSSVVDPKTVLYLSGGRTPFELYKYIANEEKLIPGAVGMVDERFGPKLHANSNEYMLQESGLLRYFAMRDIPFYPILSANPQRDKTADAYDAKVRELNATFPKSIGILGIGLDGHTAGIAGNRNDFQNPIFSKDRLYLLVSEFNDQKGIFKERVTMTFLGLSMLDILVVLVFGEDKVNALKMVFQDGNSAFATGFSEAKEEEIPGRFYKREDIAKKTLFITDQRV